MWNKHALQNLLAERWCGRRLIVVSHEPPETPHLASGLNPVLSTVGGTWIFCGSEDTKPRSFLSSSHPGYKVRRLQLSRELEDEYYHGLANRGLWPLCHAVFRRPVFERSQWERYRRANELFAEAVLEEANGQPAIVFVQNYAMALLPALLKMRNPDLLLAQFWHVPWPNPETFSIFPWKQELLQGLLANDLLGFHLRYDCCNFMDSAHSVVEARIDREHGEITHSGRRTLVLPFPMGINTQRHATVAASPSVDREIDRWKSQLGLQTEFTGVGIDRLDCISGIPERLRAIDGFLGRHAEYRERFTFLQIGLPSAEQPSMERSLCERITAQVGKINANWGNRFWQPVVFLQGDFSQTRLIALHRLAHFCLVNSLHDGMSSLAKEFVVSRIDGDGVLILSQFSGAASEFSDAILVNPFAEREMEAAIYEALRLPATERRRRMRRLRETAAANNVHRWAGKIFSTLLRFEVPGTATQVATETLPQFATTSVVIHSDSPFGSEYPVRL